jgi:mono/diheme cytochrome c family protein
MTNSRDVVPAHPVEAPRAGVGIRFTTISLAWLREVVGSNKGNAMTKIIFIAGLLSGCIYSVSPPHFANDHPGNPGAQASTLPVLTRSPQSYDPAAAPADGTPETDHGSMNHAEHDAVNEPHTSMRHHWSAPAEARARKNPIAKSEESMARGHALFTQHCVVCHGEQGHGDGPAAAALNPKPPNLTMAGRHHSAGDLAWKIANGRGAMPAWKGTLTENQIWDLVNFVQGLAGGKRGGAAHDHSEHKH